MRASRWLRVGTLRLLLVGLLACAPAGEGELVPRSTLFVGVDVSGSFEDDGRWDDAMAFAAHYIYGHLKGKAELEEPRALFVGAIGGETPGQPQAFHPIHDFEGKTPAEIEADLRQWFAPDDAYTDFNAFFRRAASLVQRQNLVLAPITLVLLTDGVPDVGHTGAAADAPERYQALDLEPLEYLARNVTVRVLYPEPAVAVRWERDVPRDRVRMWTVDDVVMRGWREQLREPDRATGSDLAGGTRIAAASPDELAGRTQGATASAATGDGTPDPGTETTGEGAPEAGAAGDTGMQTGAQPEGPGDTVVEDGGIPIYGDPREAPRPSTRRVRGVDIPEPAVPEQPELWRWIQDNVDFRVGRRVF